MIEEIKAYLAEGDQHMDDAIVHLQKELIKIRAGKAATSMLNGIIVDYYGSPTPLEQVANLGLSDARTINIQPWEKKMLSVIEKAIFEANLGLTPMNDGESIRLNVPPLTEDRRKDLVKHVKALGEDAKVSLRTARHKLMDFIKKSVKDGFPEDSGKRKEDEIQNMVNAHSDKIDALIAAKEKDILTI
jgi:ribosome recycling factor